MNGPFLVVPGDHGIRPAGPSDRCFYCNSAVGTPHGPECVCVVRNVAFDVRVDGRPIGMWVDAKPAHWTAEDCQRHANDSSWCKDNMLDTGDYTGAELPDPGEGCLCDVVTLRVVSMESETWRAR